MTNDSSHSSAPPVLSSRLEASRHEMPYANLQPDPPFWTKTSWLQLGYGVWVNMTLVGVGLTFGFSAVANPQLRTPDSSVVITANEETMITSVLTLSAPVGCILSGIVTDKYGRRFSLILCQIPIAFGWFYIGFAKCARDIIVGRIITGVGIGLSLGTPRTYITEITLPNMRGVIGALPNLANSFGLTIQAILGTFFGWNVICYACGIFTIALMLSNFFLPETPYYVILKATASEARNVLGKFRSKSYNLQDEIDDLDDFKRVNNIHRLTTIETVIALFKPSSCKPFGTVMFYVCVSQCVGVTVVVMWAVQILEDCNSSIDPHLGNVILGVSRISFAFITSCLLYRVGRRPMALISAVGVGVSCIALGLFLRTYDEKSIFPQLFLIGYISFATLGYNTIPFLIMSELLPLQIRGLVSGIVLSCVMLLMFGTNQTYPMMSRKLGLENTFFVYGSISLLGAIILYFILPETKNLSLQEIEEYYNSRRPTLVSQRQVMAMQLQEISRTTTLSKNDSKNKKKKYTRTKTESKDKHLDAKRNHSELSEMEKEDLRIKSKLSIIREKDQESELMIADTTHSLPEDVNENRQNQNQNDDPKSMHSEKEEFDMEEQDKNEKKQKMSDAGGIVLRDDSKENENEQNNQNKK